jgi:cyclopropane-fatty-acyl-phospholipid synthase
MRNRKPSVAARAARRILFHLLEDIRAGELTLVCPDGTHVFGSSGSQLAGIIEVHDERLFPRVLLAGDIGFGEAFMDGDWSSPALTEALRVIVRNQQLFDNRHRAFSFALRILERLRHLLRSNTPAGSRRNIAYHYDLGNEFYRLFLDPRMIYSCAYFESPDDSLEQAQWQKLERICQKLALRPDDHLLEIGTGWGGLAVHAATRYGCRVTTTTISRRQYEDAKEWIERCGLEKQVTVLLRDYRELSGQFNKIVSIEMFEAVGFRHYDAFFRQCDRLLTSDGAMLLQTITLPDWRFRDYLRRRDWIQKYIFPGAELASVGGILQSLARVSRLQMFHAEEIGLHYALTLRAWRERFHAALPRVRALGFDDRFIRMWDFYLASCEAAFAERSIGDVQFLFARADSHVSLWGDPSQSQEAAFSDSRADAARHLTKAPATPPEAAVEEVRP